MSGALARQVTTLNKIEEFLVSREDCTGICPESFLWCAVTFFFSFSSFILFVAFASDANALPTHRRCHKSASQKQRSRCVFCFCCQQHSQLPIGSSCIIIPQGIIFLFVTAIKIINLNNDRKWFTFPIDEQLCNLQNQQSKEKSNMIWKH